MLKISRSFVYGTFGLAALFLLSACETVPTLNTKHVVVAPDDSLLVDCDVAAPPTKKDYLSVVPAAGTDEVSILIAAVKTSEERERKMAAWGLQQTTNLSTCNVRWKGVRDFKVKSKKEIEALDTQKGK